MNQLGYYSACKKKTFNGSLHHLNSHAHDKYVTHTLKYVYMNMVSTDHSYEVQDEDQRLS